MTLKNRAVSIRRWLGKHWPEIALIMGILAFSLGMFALGAAWQEASGAGEGRSLDLLAAAALISLLLVVLVYFALPRHRWRPEAQDRPRRLAEALRGNVAAITSTLDLQEVLQRILVHIQPVMPPYDAGRVMLLENGVARVVSSRGYTALGADGEAVMATRLNLEEIANLRWMYEHRRPLATPDTRRYDGWVVVEPLQWIRSSVGAPIIFNDDVVGFLVLDSANVNTFTQEHAEQLQVFANQAGIAIRNARLFEAERRQREIANALFETTVLLNSTLSLEEVLDHLLVYVRMVVPYDAANVMLIEGRQARVARCVGYDVPDRPDPQDMIFDLDETPNLRFMVDTRQILAIPDVVNYEDWVKIPGTEWIRSWMGIPILSRAEEVLGVLSLDSAQVGTYTDELHDVLMSFANAAAVAIENARLFESEHRQREIAETLQDIAVTLIGELKLDAILPRILQQAARLLPYDAAGIWLEGRDGMFRLVLGVGYERFGVDERIKELVISPDDDLVVMNQIDSGSVLILPDVRRDERWVFFEGFEWIRSWAGVAIVVQGQVIGKLVFDHTEPEFYGPQHEPILQALATHVSIAVENAKLFAVTQQYLEHMLALRLVSMDMAASQQDLDAILELAVEHFNRLLAADACGVWLWEPEEEALILGPNVSQIEDYEPPVSRLAMGEGLSGRALAKRQVLVVDDYVRWNGAAEPFVTRPFHASLAAPMLWQGEPVGVLVAVMSDPAKHFSEDEIRFAELYASHIAPIVINAQLYAEVQRYALSLQELVDVRTAELNRERAQLQAILDSMGEGVIYTEGARTRYVNNALAVMTGRSIEELSGLADITDISTLADDPEQLTAYVNQMSRVLALGGVWRSDVQLRRRDGTVFDASVTTALVSAPGEGPPCVVTLVRDVSSEKALQAQKDRFIAHASHELRTPLTNINTRLYLARRQPDKLGEHLDVIAYVTDRMRELVENLLDLARLEKGIVPLARREVILQTLVEAVIAVQQGEAEVKAIHLQTEMVPEPLQAFVDPARIEQVLTNLVANAINYTPEQGSVTVRLTTKQAADTRYAIVTVEDTGIGIAPDMLPHVFEPFFRVEEGVTVGAGLGLTIAKEIVEQHGGEMAVESSPGEGSIFMFSLPLNVSTAGLERRERRTFLPPPE